jgi:hypothetical protein
MGDRLFINGEEVIFKAWIDQSQTSIEVQAIADNSLQIKQIRAKEIKSLWRSPDFAENSQPPVQKASSNASSNASHDLHDTESNINTEPESVDYANSSEIPSEPQAEEIPESIPETIPETIKEPEYNAWEVWTYLERQRVKTLKLLNTFQAEWEANRFVREAERSAPANLRVHYEIRPIWLDPSEIYESTQDYENLHKSTKNQSDRDQHDQVDDVDYVDAIDVEVVGES